MGLFDRLFSGFGTKTTTPKPESAQDIALRLIDKGNMVEEDGNLDEAMRFYEEAIETAPDLARPHLNCGNIHLARGDAEKALHAYQHALSMDSRYAAAHYNAGNALTQLGQLEEARLAYEKAIEQKPDFVDAHVALGCTFDDLGRRQEAVDAYRKALDINPEYAEVHSNLGKSLLALGQQDAAIASFERVLQLKPDNDDDLFMLGMVQKSRGQFESALANLQNALAATPTNVVLLINVGDACLELHRVQEAIAYYIRALEIDPKLAVAENNLGNAYFGLGQFAEAVAHYRRATELQPDFAAAHGNLGAVLRDIGEPLEGLKSLSRSLELEPNAASVRSNLLLLSHSLDNQSPEHLFQEAKIYGEIVARHATPRSNWKNSRLADRRLRVGLVSGDFCIHPVGFFIEGVLHALASADECTLDMVAFSNSVLVDQVTERIRSAFVEWHDIFGLLDNEAADLIAEREIDILIDLSGHTARNRLPVFAWKPAPIQVSWLGYFATTGVDAIDHLIADPWTLPESEEAYFTEAICRLPDTRLCFTAPDLDVVVRPLPANSEGITTFGCFNNLIKMHDAVVALWSRVLAEVPDSRLFLKARQLYHEDAKLGVTRRFAEHGIAASRLVLEGPESRSNYFAAYNRVDIALDPFPYTGGTTTAEALWMGVPVLTLAGKNFLSRQGVGLLMNAGLPDWIATDADDYVARAKSHAENRASLAELRLHLRDRVVASPVFDGPRFAGQFEAALRTMWIDWCNRPFQEPS